MKDIVYRVSIKIGYYTAYFDFKEGAEASAFALSALTHSLPNDDTDKATYVNIQVLQEGADDDTDGE